MLLIIRTACQMPITAPQTAVDRERELGVDDLLLCFDDLGLLFARVATFTTAELMLRRPGMANFVFLRHRSIVIVWLFPVEYNIMFSRHVISSFAQYF